MIWQPGCQHMLKRRYPFSQVQAFTGPPGLETSDKRSRFIKHTPFLSKLVKPLQQKTSLDWLIFWGEIPVCSQKGGPQSPALLRLSCTKEEPPPPPVENSPLRWTSSQRNIVAKSQKEAQNPNHSTTPCCYKKIMPPVKASPSDWPIHWEIPHQQSERRSNPISFPQPL